MRILGNGAIRRGTVGEAGEGRGEIPSVLVEGLFIGLFASLRIPRYGEGLTCDHKDEVASQLWFNMLTLWGPRERIS